eukprot:354765-Chlamydomonas_euryale.AAC.3
MSGMQACTACRRALPCTCTDAGARSRQTTALYLVDPCLTGRSVWATACNGPLIASHRRSARAPRGAAPTPAPEPC